MKLFRFTLLLFIATALFTSCKKNTSKQTRFIPKEAVVVAAINTKSLKDKLVKSQATLNNLFKSLTGTADTAMEKGKKEWEELNNSGIDLEEDIYLSVVQKGGGAMSMEQESSVFTAVGILKDAAKFESYLKKKDATAQVTKDKDFSYAIKDDNMVAWGKEVIVFMSQTQRANGPLQFDTTTNDYKVRPVQADVKKDIKAEMTTYFNLKEDESVSSIAEFKDLTGQKADGRLWVNHANSTNIIPFPLPKLKELTENSYTAATLNFEEGKILMESKTYSGKAMGEILEKHKGKSVNLDMVKNYPSNNVNAFFISSFNPEFINGVVQFLEVGSFVDGFLTRTMGATHTLQDVLMAVKGDVSFIVSDVDPGAKWVGNMNASNMGKVFINIPVGDKAQFNKLLDKLVEQQMMVKSNNEYKLNPVLSSIGYKVSVDDKNFIVASDSSVITQYKSGSAKSNIDTSILNGFKGKSSVGFIDLERIMNALSADSTNAEFVSISKNTFKNVRAYTENFNGKHIEGRMEINMKDEKENSLTSLLKFIAATSSGRKPRSVQQDINDGNE